jgi:hypothetical protein
MEYRIFKNRRAVTENIYYFSSIIEMTIQEKNIPTARYGAFLTMLYFNP